MRILYLVPRLHLPPVNSSTEYHADMLQTLAERGHEIDVVCYADEQVDLREIEYICRRFEPIRKPLSPFGSLTSVLLALIHGIPLTVQEYRSREFVACLDTLVRQSHSYDVALLEHIQMAQFAPRLRAYGIPVVLRLHDIEAQKLRRLAVSDGPPLMRLFGLIESCRMWRYEREMVRCFPTIAMTEHDRQVLSEGQKDAYIKVVPLAINCDRYCPEDKQSLTPIRSKYIVFVGPVDYYKNAISLLWFIKNVFPLVQHAIPDAHLRIVNIRQDSPLAQRLSIISGVSMIEYLNDIRLELARSSVIIAPMRIASGMSGRVLTALAMAKPLVATSMACQGIEIVHGEHAWIADNPEDFAHGVCTLLMNTSLAQTIGRRGRRLVEEKYDLRHVAALLEQTLTNLVSRV